MKGKIDFEQYLEEFEQNVIVEGYKKGIFGERKAEVVPLRRGKLSTSPIGNFVGKQFKFPKLLAINYYGLFKLSDEIFNAVDSVKDIFHEVRTIKSPVVHFSSVTMEHVREVAPEMLQDFPEFKKHLVELRWKNKETTEGKTNSQ
jgi:hypothetical protein